MTEREKIHSGNIYWPNDPTIMEEQLGYLDLMDEYNRTPRRLQAERSEMLKGLFAEVGENCYIESPYFANWGGHHVHLGKNVYINSGLKLVDDTHIYVGDDTMFGPNVTIATAGHPICPELRARGLQYNMPVRIGRNCWLGAGVIVMPGAYNQVLHIFCCIKHFLKGVVISHSLTPPIHQYVQTAPYWLPPLPFCRNRLDIPDL
mgnify:CR=1 FL=1